LKIEFNFARHLQETLIEGNKIKNAWDYYRNRIDEFVMAVEQLYPTGTPLTTIFSNLLVVIFEGGFSKFEPLITFIKKNAPTKYLPLTDEFIYRVLSAFTCFALDKYVKEKQGVK